MCFNELFLLLFNLQFVLFECFRTGNFSLISGKKGGARPCHELMFKPKMKQGCKEQHF